MGQGRKSEQEKEGQWRRRGWVGQGEKMDSPAVYTQAVGGGGYMFSLLKESGDRRTLRKSQEKCLQVFLVPCSCFRLKVIVIE